MCFGACRAPLLLVIPMAASASFWVYGSSFSAFSLSHELVSATVEYKGWVAPPSFVVAALAVRHQALVRLKPFCALDAVELSQAR